jgi:hypothetical protein
MSGPGFDNSLPDRLIYARSASNDRLSAARAWKIRKIYLVDQHPQTDLDAAKAAGNETMGCHDATSVPAGLT